MLQTRPRKIEIKNDMVKINGVWESLLFPVPIDKVDSFGNYLKSCYHKKTMFVRIKGYDCYRRTCLSCKAKWIEIFKGKEKR